MITNIVTFSERNNLIIEKIRELVDEDRKILLLSDRRDHLSLLENMIGTYCSVGYYIGGMKESELIEAEKAQLILGTYAMASTGLDIPDLDSLILASPKSDIEQSVGRILRKKHAITKRIIDICDTFSVFFGQNYKRLRFYKKQEYEVLGEEFPTNIWDVNFT